ncbi:MAG: J domain-containing protein [Pseudomonadota bacterium]|nr:J domain-containing protein [Pseudomonadota bacterium]
MSDPYLILGVGEDADDAAIETAYLEGIKRCPPERDARRFEAVRTAYETLRTHRDRLAYELFDTSPTEPADVLDRAAPIGASRRPEPALFAALLRGDA